MNFRGLIKQLVISLREELLVNRSDLACQQILSPVPCSFSSVVKEKSAYTQHTTAVPWRYKKHFESVKKNNCSCSFAVCAPRELSGSSISECLQVLLERLPLHCGLVLSY